VTPIGTSDSRAADNRPDPPTVDLLLFAAARLAAGRARDRLAGRRLADVMAAACERYGPDFADVLGRAQVWVNGDPAGPDHLLAEGDEVAVLPPVSGGAGCR